MERDPLLKKFEDYLRVEKNVSPHTQRNYVTDLRQFSHYLQSECPEKDFTTVDSLTIRSYLGVLHKETKNLQLRENWHR